VWLIAQLPKSLEPAIVIAQAEHQRVARSAGAAARDLGQARYDQEARGSVECLDSTERAPHLAGALGDAVAEALVRRRWIRRKPDSRVIALTPSGSRGLHAALGVELSAS
jgi:hypothetical protein